jgi:hypothetical protein
MRLIDPTVVLDHLAKENSTDNLLAATSAVELATAACEARLSTSFNAGTAVDVMYITSSMPLGLTAFQTRLLASRGFITSASLTTVKALGVAKFGTDEETALTNVVINYDKGIVTLVDDDLTGYYVKLSYSYGFANTGGLYTGAPEWLQEACKLMALMTLISGPNPTITEKKDVVESTPKALATQFETIMAQNIRYAPGAAMPL